MSCRVVAGTSSIEWTSSTWNPVTGCSKTSPGCKNCYAERMAHRLMLMGQDNYRNGFEVTCHSHMLERPLTWKKSQMIFTNSMSDLFHRNVPTDFILDVFDVMNRAGQHYFQVLTKRSGRLLQLDSKLPWTKNIWMGVSVETENYVNRIDDLRKTSAAIRFLSIEPLLGPIPNLDLRGIDWVIVGGESGPRARPMSEEWVIEIRDQCVDAGVPFFFKQWGGVNKKKAGRVLEKKVWSQMPLGYSVA